MSNKAYLEFEGFNEAIARLNKLNANTKNNSENQVEAATTQAKKKTKKANAGDIDLSKIKDGTYEGQANGYRGLVKVSVTVKDHKITAIKVLSNSDDAAFFNRASAGVIKNILAKQSLKVDVVSGATYSSNGIIKAVKNALTGEEADYYGRGTMKGCCQKRLMLMKQDTKRQLLKVDKEASAAREKAYQDYVMQYEMAVAKQQSEAWRKAIDGVPDSLRMLLEINNIENVPEYSEKQKSNITMQSRLMSIPVTV